MFNDPETREKVCFHAKRALMGLTPTSLRAYSFQVDAPNNEVLVRAHFDREPTEDELEDMGAVETEINAAFWDSNIETDVEIAPPGTPLTFRPDGIVYLRAGEAGEICHCNAVS